MVRTLVRTPNACGSPADPATPTCLPTAHRTPSNLDT